MTQDIFWALLAYAFATSITPGPNNLMLMASGTNFGVRRTVPHALGVALGFAVLAVCAGLGLVQVFDAVPGAYTALTIFSVAYMLFLAWKIANAAPHVSDEAQAAELTASSIEQQAGAAHVDAGQSLGRP
ncbi:MAG: LysE family translocator, partial [Pseudomonadota bacterium]